MANSDPALLRMFAAWVESYLLPGAAYSAQLSLHAGNDEAAARLWWSQELATSRPRFVKTFLKPDGSGHRKNHLGHGVCHAFAEALTRCTSCPGG
jgi:hypothetical protein